MTSTALPVLYSFRRCPYAMRARLALRQAGVAVELREVVLRDKPPALLRASPKGTVPVLQLPQGQVLDESLDIMRWALTQHDPDGWLQPDDPEAMQHWIACNDGAFKPLLDRYKYPERHPGATPAQWREQAVSLLLEPMQARLAAGAWLAGSRCSLADVALFPFIRQFAQVDAAWFAAQPWPQLHAWLGGFASSPAFDAVMARRAPWREGAPPTIGLA